MRFQFQYHGNRNGNQLPPWASLVVSALLIAFGVWNIIVSTPESRKITIPFFTVWIGINAVSFISTLSGMLKQRKKKDDTLEGMEDRYVPKQGSRYCPYWQSPAG